MGIEDYLSWWHLQWLGIYTLANCAIPWYVIWLNRRLAPVKGREVEKYAPWVRVDIGEWSYVRVIFTHFFFLPRYAVLLLILAVALIGIFILSIGASIDNLGPTRKMLITEYTCLCMRVFSPFFGVVYYSTSRPKADYKEWLGPDWEPKYDGATILVSNH